MMYLTLRQHDMFRTLVMGFEIPFRSYIAKILMENFDTEEKFKQALISRKNRLTNSDTTFLRQTLPSICTDKKLKEMYNKFCNAYENAYEKIIENDRDVPMVGGLNIVTFSFTTIFTQLYRVFGGYGEYCVLAEKYRYARNKLDHPGCKTLEDSDMFPVLSFIKDTVLFLDDQYFCQKSKASITNEIIALQKRKIEIPISRHNFSDMPYGESRIVCREAEIEMLKRFICGNPENLRKQHSCCIFGYGGVGKTALVLETLKLIVRDIQEQKVINEYSPQYMLFFSAKKQKLDISVSSGKILEKSIQRQFATTEELVNLILMYLERENLKGFHDDGVVIIDNLESLSDDERQKIKQFVETQTPAEMQFIVTSRNSEEYENNFKLQGFNEESGIDFVRSYITENVLDIEMDDKEIQELLQLSKGNTLVLVLCLRRLSQRLSSMSGLAADFSSSNAWGNIRKNLKRSPGNAYEVISEFMFKDTFEEMEKVFSGDIELFYKILKIFAVYRKEGVDLNTICLLSKEAYPKIEAVADTLCNYLILEKHNEYYNLNDFAEKYIINRFMPDATTYEELSAKIQQRERQVKAALEKLDADVQNRSELANILKDWCILTDSDRITAAKMYHLYGEVKKAISNDSKLKTEHAFETVIRESDEAEKITIHPYIKYQKARILQLLDRSKILSELHTEEIMESFRNAIFVIKTAEQYASILQTKSYASLLWMYGQYLSDNDCLEDSIRYLEGGRETFQELNIEDQEYYQCLSKLGEVYLANYLKDRSNKLRYLKMARSVSKELQGSYKKLGKAAPYANHLKQELQKYGTAR